MNIAINYSWNIFEINQNKFQWNIYLFKKHSIAVKIKKH